MSEAYHLGELRIAQDPRHPSHILPPPVPAGTRVLDVGCGAGQTLAVAYPNLESFGLDVDVGAMNLGRRIAPNVRFAAGRAEQLPFGDAQFDFVIARVSLAYTNIPDSLREICRVLKPRGKLWITLHSFSVPWASVKGSNWKGKVFFAYIVLNSLSLHFLGRVLPFFGRYESFQTQAGITRVLKRGGFADIVVERGRHFLVTARSASHGVD
ncbi:MAG: class I SAM-dependent methyltransferase [Bryobacteraceae bacterium]